MVALTPRCAAELGYQLSDEDKGRAYIEVSGRKGFGVKADDLLDRLIASAKNEVDSRHPQLPEIERAKIATQIAVGALRYFMLKFTKSSVIAFDFKEALSFEVRRARTRNMRRCAPPTSSAREVSILTNLVELLMVLFPCGTGKYLDGEAGNEIWELWLTASRTSYIVDQCIATTEPAYLAKHAFQLAQLFNAFYHRHPILSEPDEGRKTFLLATVVVVRRN